MTLLLRPSVLSLLLLLALTGPASAANCGDKAGPGNGDVPCACGDTVVTSTRLTSADPVVYTGGGDAVCPDQGLSAGANRVRIDCDELTLRGDGTGNGIEVIGAGGVRVQGCELRDFLHAVRADTCGGFRLSGSRLIDSAVNGLFMTDCNEASVRGNRVEGSNGNGIELIGSNASSVKDNEVRQSNGNGIDLQNSRGITVSGNLSEDNLQDNLELGDSMNNEIKGNTFEGATFAGIHILSTTSNGNVFRKNTLSGNGTFDVHNGSGAGDNGFKGNACASSLGPDVDCP